MDLTFSNRTVTNVLSLALQTDGTILVGSTDALVRVHDDGPVSAATNIATILLQPDGKALVARRGATLRVDTFGVIDPTFSAPGNYPSSAFNPIISRQGDGKVVFQRNFWGTGALGRMESNGALNTNYSVDVWYAGKLLLRIHQRVGAIAQRQAPGGGQF